MKRAMAALAALAILVWGFGSLRAAPPVPEQINYQGILRGASGLPLEGLYDMVFRLFDADAGGQELIVDAHEASGTGAVVVSRGLFNVALGTGQLSDGGGTGPGDPYTSLYGVFRDFGEVWLEIQIGGETLSPRTRISASAYAINSAQLGGLSAGSFGQVATDNAWSGRNTQSRIPTGAGIADGALYLNPASAPADSTLLGAAVGGSPKLRLDADGDLSVNRYLVAQSLYGKGISPWVALEDAAGANLLTTLQAWDAADAMWLDDHQNGRTVLYSGTGGIAIGTTQTDPAYTVNTPSLKVTGDQFLGGTLRMDGGSLDLDGGPLRQRNAVGTLLLQLFTSDSSNYSYLYDYQNAQYMLFSNANGIGIGTTAPLNSYAVTMPSLYLSSGGTYGILAEGSFGGGAFQDGNQSGFGRVGYADYGGWFQGNSSGSYSVDADSSANALVGSSTYKILGTGAVSFIQNHPADHDKVIVYAAPEGDEVATYTRGTARLAGGAARVALGETFKWVTNPDLGLTAWVTPRGSWSDLYVESVTTSELLVRSAGGAPDARFDYVVFGLRIGFEETSVIQEKTREARIPSMADHALRYERAPDLRRFNARERFGAMEPATAAARADGDESSASRSLRDAIGVFDSRLHTLPLPPGTDPSDVRIERAGGGIEETPPVADRALPAGAAARTPDAGRGEPSPARSPAPGTPTASGAASPASRSASLGSGLVESHRTSEPVEAGDVLVADPRVSGRLARGRTEADPAVVGIAADGSRGVESEEGLEALVTLAGTTSCKVDASYGAIRVGDLLTASPTPGHARVAVVVTPGTILGKALEPLDSGTGRIRVLVMPR